MARNSAGKWVARAGATGGGRTYRGQTPVNWYAAVVIIVVLGILSVVFANYEYRHPASAATSTTQPTTKTTWYAGITFDVCGKTEPALASNVSSTKSATQAFYTSGKGVIIVSPKTDSQAGKNAVLGKFVTAYPDLALTATELKLPASTGKTSTIYKAGQACPKGTPDAGKKGQVQVEYWPSAFDTKANPTTVSGDPSTLKFSANQLIAVGFVPSGTKLGKTATVVTAMLDASAGTTTTTTAPATTAPAPAATTSSTTTAPAATTTTAPPPTTTTAPKK